MSQTKNSSAKIIIGIIMVCFMCQASMIVGPALADLSKAYPDIPYSNILLISTIPQLCGIPVALITGKIAGTKVRYRTLAASAAFFAAVGGALPFFFRSFPVILASRVIYGLAYNVAVPLANALPLLYFDEQRAANLMGVSAAAQSIAGTVVQLIAGVVCAVNVHLTWLVHLYLLLPLIGILVFLPEPQKQAMAEAKLSAESGEKPKKNYKLPVFQFAMFGFAFCVFYPLILNMSSIIIGENLGTSAIAGTVLSVYTIAGMVGGMVFGQIYKLFKNYTIPVLLCCLVVSLALGYFGKSVALLMVACAFGGVGFSSFAPALMVRARAVLPPEAISPAAGVMSACLKIGAFLAAYYVSLVTKVSGNSNPRVPVLVGLVVIAVITVVWTISIAKESSAKKAA